MHLQSYVFTNEIGKHFYYNTLAETYKVAHNRPDTTIHAVTTSGIWLLLK